MTLAFKNTKISKFFSKIVNCVLNSFDFFRFYSFFWVIECLTSRDWEMGLLRNFSGTGDTEISAHP